MDVDGEEDKIQSPAHSQQTISDDDEIDYSVKPEFYDPDLDEKDELWVEKKRKGVTSDAVLSCPACFTTLCLECQRHEKYVTRYRAVFVVNCNVKSGQVLQQRSMEAKRGKRRRDHEENEGARVGVGGEMLKPVCCSVCSTEVGTLDEDEVYHFFNVLPRLARIMLCCLHLIGSGNSPVGGIWEFHGSWAMHNCPHELLSRHKAYMQLAVCCSVITYWCGGCPRHLPISWGCQLNLFCYWLLL